MRPGYPEYREVNYVRHGVRCLTANLEVATGQVLAPTIAETRNDEDFAAHISGSSLLQDLPPRGISYVIALYSPVALPSPDHAPPPAAGETWGPGHSR